MSQLYNLLYLIDSSVKIKQSYITSFSDRDLTKIVILREEVTIYKSRKFSDSNLKTILRVLLRLGYFTSEIEKDVDSIGYTTSIRVVFEYTNLPSVENIIRSLTKEMIAEDTKLKISKSQTEVTYLETTKKPLITIESNYEPLSIPIYVSSYGVVEINDQTSYVYSISFNEPVSGAKAKVCLKYLLPNELLEGSLTKLTINQVDIDVFSLPDKERIIYSKKNSTGFIHDGKRVLYGKAAFLASVLPLTGWFVKINKRVGKVDTILLTETSWEMSAAQKAYVVRNNK